MVLHNDCVGHVSIMMASGVTGSTRTRLLSPSSPSPAICQDLHKRVTKLSALDIQHLQNNSFIYMVPMSCCFSSCGITNLSRSSILWQGNHGTIADWHNSDMGFVAAVSLLKAAVPHLTKQNHMMGYIRQSVQALHKDSNVEPIPSLP